MSFPSMQSLIVLNGGLILEYRILLRTRPNTFVIRSLYFGVVSVHDLDSTSVEQPLSLFIPLD